MTNLSVRSVLLLGGGSDIGVAAAQELAHRGARHFVLAARKPDQLSGIAEGLASAGAETVAVVQFDAAATETHPMLMSEIFRAHGPIDLVLWAAGVLGPTDDAQLDRVEALTTLETNLVGAVSALLSAVVHLREQGHGQLVVLSSVAAQRARSRNFVYGASKAGLDGFCQGLRMALAGTGVSVLIVRPGFVRTKMTEGLPRPPLTCAPDEVASAIVAGLGRGAKTVWVPRSMRLVMTVLRLLPEAVLRRLPV